MDCSKILPGAVNPGSCSVATGYLGDLPFICYASGQNLIFLNGNLKHIQTVMGADLDYGRCCVSCMHVAEFTGRVAASWGHNVVIFKPEPIEGVPQEKFAWSWKLCQTLKFSFKVHSISWNREGSRVLVGGESISMWVGELVREEGREDGEQWKEVWSMKMPSIVTHLKFSPDGTMFASAYQNDRLVKIWYRKRPRALANDSPHTSRRKSSSKAKGTEGREGKREVRYNFTYVGHPRAVTGCVWRKTSPHMPRGAVPNVLLTTCHDNICRLWSHVIMKEKAPLADQLQFFLAATIDPVADIPFRSTMPVEDAAFIVHWLNNKELTYTSRTAKLRKSASHQSLASLAQGGPAEEMLASWVCVEESLTPEMEKQRHIYALEDYLAPASVTRGACPSPAAVRDPVSQSKKQLLDEWWNLPDLLVCIHPNNGSLMVWTVEGLDAPRHSTRLVHLSFSSCLPHVFPPHLAQTLHLELQQFLLKEPEVTPSSHLQSTTNTSELSLPVPQIRLPGRGSMDIPDSTRALRSDSSLILLSSHCNGSLNSWSVELTVQAGFCTSIAGLIHCGRTGGHRSEVNAVYRHPWLPVLMTVSSSHCHQHSDNELIVWNADLAGPLESKSQLQELSRVSSPENGSFSDATWLPPISLTSSSAEALSRCPSFGLFVTNIGRELCLFQTSLYPIIPPNSIGVYHTTQPLYDLSQKTITVTSHSGYNGISFVKTIDEDLGKYDEIIGLHTFRLSSIVLQESNDEEFDHSNEALIVLIENQKIDSVSHIPSFSSSTPSYRSYLHVWKVVLIAKTIESPSHKTANMDPWFQPHSQITSACEASVMKLFSGVFPLHNPVSHIVSVHPACDVSSSLQLQLPMLSSPYLFTTVSSDGDILNWQFHITAPPSSSLESEAWKLVVYDVFKPGSYRSAMKSPAKILNCTTHKNLKELPLQSHLPCALNSAYPGRFAMAHLLNKPLKTLPAINPLGKHAVVSVWECESSGGLAWTCESMLPLQGFGVVTSPSKLSSLTSTNPVHMDWIPMENGSYLLATCFSSVISIFGMALPLVSSEEIQGKPLADWQRRFSKSVSVPVFSSMQASSSWVCLLHFPCAKTYPGLSTQWLSYTGSNSILVGVGCEMHLYTCWVTKERLDALSSKTHGSGNSAAIRKQLHSQKHSRMDMRLAHSDRINLLDYAHSKNTPRPQYHPKILIDLLNMGKMDAVKLILVNLVKYLLLYQVKSKKKDDSEFISFDERIRNEQEEEGPRMRMLSFADGRLQRSRGAGIKVEVENIPPVSLSQLDLFSTESATATSTDAEAATDSKETHKEEDDDYDALFTDYSDVLDSDITLGETAETDDIKFPELNLDPGLFTPKMADKLRSILCYARLPDVSDLEQVHLLAIAQTVARTKMNIGVCQDEYSTTSLSIGGCGYASAGFVQGGIGGGEAMDDCGLRFLLALHNHHMLTKSLPKDVVLEGLLPSNFVWAFHSDAESELLSNIPCVQEDKLNWADLKSVGVGWWVRSSDTLRKLVEKLAKAQFMEKQDPMAASLFYLAMKKQSLLKGLFKTVSEQKMAQFFSNDFTQDRWHRAALKNSFVLMSKQRFEHAAAFFLLAGQVWDAVKVCVERLHDLQLALVIVRLHEGDNSPIYERVLKRFILGIDSKSDSCSYPEEPSPDPFLRSIALWLLKDYLGSLQTLLVEQQLTSSPTNSSIYNFYFFLRSHPLLLRSKHPAKRGRTIAPSPSVASFSTQFHHQNQLSGVGGDPLTPTERNLVFNTAYFHLNSGSPLLSLMVLSQLPKCEDLGRAEQIKEELSLSLKDTAQRKVSSESVSGMITSGTLTRDFTDSSKNEEDFDWSQPAAFQIGTPTKEIDEFDWSKPASAQLSVIKEVEEMDWSKPVSVQTDKKEEDEFDWSQPVSSQVGGLLDDEPDWLEQEEESDKQNEEAGIKEENEEVRKEEEVVCKALTPRGWFVICLAEQLQYNALLSILTEELTTIHLPACSSYLWNYSGGSDALPLLPVEKLDVGGDQSKSMVEWFGDEPFTQVLGSLQATLVDWLRSEIKLVKDVCRIEVGAGTTSKSPGAASHSGYDVLATLTNYMALHAGTLPSMVVVKMELMHLMNTLLPWSVGLSHPMEDSEGQIATCAINPVQVPLLTSSALPAKHPLNLALQLRILSASIFDLLSVHSIPPTSNHPIDHIDRVFELCCSLSHSIFLCLSPMRLQAADSSQPDSRPGSAGATRQRASSFTRVLDFLSTLDSPNTKASKWPGLDDWPHSLLSDDGKEASPLCLLLAECLAVVYVGLLAVGWSRHSIYDLLVVVANVPTPEVWAHLFGGGVVLRPQEGGGAQRRAAKWVSSMKKMIWQNSSEKGHKDDHLSSVGLFAAPKISFLHQSLSKPAPRSNSPSRVNFEKEPDSDSDDEYFSEEGEDAADPECFSWCLMNLCIIKIVQKSLRATVSLTGMETLEFITTSPVLYKLLGLLEDWETVFLQQMEDYAFTPPALLQDDNEEQRFGPALMRHKFILEPENSPFRADSKQARLARRLWSYLVHEESVRETFIHYIFTNNKRSSNAAVDEEPPVQRILYHDPDSYVSSFCINASNSSVFALATTREVLEVEIPDITSLESLPDDIEGKGPWSSRTSPETPEDFILVQPSAQSLRRGSAMLTPTSLVNRFPLAMHSQTGSASSMLMKRHLSGVKRMAAHPNLAYYLTGSADGSVRLYEFGIERALSVLRKAGAGPGITRIRFTPQGNKYGVTDTSGKLCLWQGISTSSRPPYQTLNPSNTRRTISDFAFLGSSSLIATCGDFPEHRNICIWDTLLPARSNIVNEFMCHEGGASAIVYSNSTQRLVTGGKKGEIFIIDLRLQKIVTRVNAHATGVNTIVINDTENYFVSGSADGDIKVWDLFTVHELTSFAGKHARSRLFRSEGGVLDMVLDPSGWLYSCGADGTVKVNKLDVRHDSFSS